MQATALALFEYELFPAVEAVIPYPHLPAPSFGNILMLIIRHIRQIIPEYPNCSLRALGAS